MMGNGVVFYRVVSAITGGPAGGGRGTGAGCCHRRFREFLLFFASLKQAFAQGSRAHLASSLPPPPKKQAKLLHDHHAAGFIEGRRAGLEVWLRRLLMVHARRIQHCRALNSPKAI